MSNRGYRPIDNARSFQRQAYTPQNMQRQGFNFDFRDQRNSRNGNNGNQNMPKIEISRNKTAAVSIVSKSEKDKIGSFQQQNMPQIQTIQPKENPASIQIKKQTPTIQQHQQPISDYTSKHSLQAFISEFEENPGYNETDLTQLGIDVSTTQPILPNLQSVFSEIPLGSKSSYKTIESYNEIKQEPDIKSRIPMFTAQTLLFIFYSGKKKDANLAAAELQRRGCIYNHEKDEWTVQNGLSWNVSKWKPEDKMH